MQASPVQDLLALGIGTHFVPSENLGKLLSALQVADLSGGADQVTAHPLTLTAHPPAEARLLTLDSTASRAGSASERRGDNLTEIEDF